VDTLSYKTISAQPSTIDKKWVLVDAENQTLGRLSSAVAKILRGKNKPSFTPHMDCGDNVVVINADKIVMTGKKWDQKVYIHHTGYPGGQRSKTATQIFEKYPERIVEKAIKGMLPKNKLGADLFRNLRVFAGETHNLEAQQPEKVNLNELL
jgi:large subunit ribosomal protein L13